jgi:hypothetical protein
METSQGNSLFPLSQTSKPLSQTSKNVMFLFLSILFFSPSLETKIGGRLNNSCPGRWAGTSGTGGIVEKG